MSNVFNSLTKYPGKWNVKEENVFNEEELNMVSKAVVVESDYGLSCCFTMKSGDSAYIPMSQYAHVTVGQILDLTKAKVLTLEKAGKEDIYRIDY